MKWPPDRRRPWTQTLFLDDPHTWPVWQYVAWAIPLGVLIVTAWMLREVR